MKFHTQPKEIKQFSDLVGQTCCDVKVNKGSGDDEIIFTLNDGRQFKLYHRQDCCENVNIEDIAGELTDLIGNPILQAEENSNSGEKDYGNFTYTYYRITTIKGQVVIRWYGSSNGYYSERVDFAQIK